MTSFNFISTKGFRKKIPIPTIMQIFCGFCIILVSFAHYYLGIISFERCMPFHVLAYGITTPFVLAFVDKHLGETNPQLKRMSFFLAFLFSQFVAIGFSFHRHHDWDLCFGNWQNVFIWFLKTICYSYVFFKIILCIASEMEKPRTFHPKNISLKKCFLVLVACRFCYVALFYPCIFGFDAAVGLRTLLDPNCASCNHHPYFVQLLHALFFRMGDKIGHISIAMALLSTLIVLLSCGIIIYGLWILKRRGINNNILYFLLFVYSAFPIFPYLSINPTKDGLFAYFFLLYIFSLYEIYTTKGLCFGNWRFILLHSGVLILLCLTRHQGQAIATIELVFLLIGYRQLWRNILLTYIAGLGISSFLNHEALYQFDVEPGGKQEVYGTFFQQTARYLTLYPSDLTDEEKCAINRVLNMDDIANKYVFDKTDPVKNGYKFNPWYRIAQGFPSMFRHIDHANEKKALAQYREAWFSMGLRHPLCYVEATMGVCYGFFYNNNRLILETEPFWSENGAATTPQYRFVHFNAIAKLYNQYIYRLFNTPFFNWPFSIAYYNWIALFLLAILFYRKDLKGIITFLPIILSIFILLICPMIYGRYAYPIIIALPILAVHLIKQRKLIHQ